MHSNVVEYSKKKIVQNECAFFNALEWRKLLMMRFNELVKRTKPHTRIIRNIQSSTPIPIHTTKLKIKVDMQWKKSGFNAGYVFEKKNLGMA